MHVNVQSRFSVPEFGITTMAKSALEALAHEPCLGGICMSAMRALPKCVWVCCVNPTLQPIDVHVCVFAAVSIHPWRSMG